METLHNGFTLDFCPGSFPLSTDSMALADFARLPKNAQVLDLGSGCATLGLLLCAKDPSCTVTGLELDPNAHTQAQRNIHSNGLSSRLYSICGDLRAMPESIRHGHFHICISNPPYFSGGPASTQTPIARRDDCCKPEELLSAAARSLRFGGDFYLVQKTERLAQICHLACLNGLEPKRLCLVRHSPATTPGFFLLQCRKGGKPGLILEELILFNTDGSPTEGYRRIYHI